MFERFRVAFRDLVFRSCVILTLVILAVSFGMNLRKPVEPERAGGAQIEHGEQKKREHFWQRTLDDPVAMFTLVLTAFTGILAVYTGVMGHATRRLVRGAENTAERQ